MRRALLSFLSVLAGACGSRTEVFGNVGSAPDASRADVVDTGLPEVRLDVTPDVPPIDVGLPDVAPTPCTSDAQCDDGVACTDDRCDLTTGTCAHTPDNTLCPAGFACRPPCAAASFAEDPDFLYGVDLPAGTVTRIGSTRGTLDDIALDGHGTLYGVGSNNLYTVDTKTGATTFVASIGATFNALDFAPDGTLYAAAAGESVVYTIDPMTGQTKQVATYPHSYVSSGDLAVIGNQLLATVTPGIGTGSDALVSIDLTTFTATVIGRTGFSNIYGLAAYGTQLFGYTYTGEVLQIDPATAKSTVLAKTGYTFYGASAR